MFDLNSNEAVKLMFENKKVIDENGSIFWIEDFKIKNNNSDIIFSFDTFLAFTIKFKEYVEPRKITFETYVGENPNTQPFNKFPIEVAFGHEVRFCDDYDALIAIYPNVSKVKLTFEIEG